MFFDDPDCMNECEQSGTANEADQSTLPGTNEHDRKSPSIAYIEAMRADGFGFRLIDGQNPSDLDSYSIYRASLRKPRRCENLIVAVQ